MNQIRFFLLLFFLVVASAPIATVSLEDSENERGSANLIAVPGRIDPDIPPLKPQLGDAAGNRGYPWHMRPDIYGFTDPPNSEEIRLPGEFDSRGGILLGWPHYVFDVRGKLKITELRDIVRHSISRTRVSILARPQTRPWIEKTLRAAGVDPRRVDFVKLRPNFPDDSNSSTLDTVWIRDYGPQFVLSMQKNRTRLHVIDMSYYPVRWFSRSDPVGRVRDDAVPGRVADAWGLPASRPPLAAEGGELLTDGRGTCFIGDEMKTTNRFFWDTSYDLNRVLGDYFGCSRTIVLKGLRGESTGHLDLFMTVLSPTTLFVGDYEPSFDRVNSKRLNANARTLEDAGYRVLRIPMPRPYSIGGQRIWATFTNIVHIQGALLVPVYRNPRFPGHLRNTIRVQEKSALTKFREELPGVSIVPVIADPLIPMGGSLHCIAINYPNREPDVSRFRRFSPDQ